ncbi:MAG: Beta-glucosidase-related glycosidase [Herbinix sp.]|nr:Beta-glucosidase-related glycosidase [Herbinix sp.]
MYKWQRVMYQPNLPLGANGEKVTSSKAHRELAKEAAKEGMVLLKNEQQVLPLKKGTKVALFGKGSFDYVKGGGGSGDVTVEYMINLYEGMKALKEQVSVFEELSDYYRDNVKSQYNTGAVPGMTVEPELPDDLLKKARVYADTAIITISRFSGEGWDRNNEVEFKNADIFQEEAAFARRQKEIYPEGDFCLTAAETTMVNKVKEQFGKVIVVMNVGGMVDSSWFKEDTSIQSVLMAWQGGMEGGLAAAELLCGLSNPSGKLSDTFAGSLEDYPSTATFHESDDYVEVNYPFGFGLSYTSFDWNVVEMKEQHGVIKARISVTNTGKMDGKEVIQIYTSAPGGLLGKSSKSLVAFEKTRPLKVGETQVLELEFCVDALASYDDLGKIQKSAYILEAGEYAFYIGTSVREVIKADFVHIETQNRIVKQLSTKLAPTSLPKRMLADGSYEELPMKQSNDMDSSAIEKLTFLETELYTAPVRAIPPYRIYIEPHKEGNIPLSDVAVGKVSLDKFIEQLTDEEIAHLLGGQPNTGVANTFGFGNMPEYGVPNVMTADGPAGLRILPRCGVNTTAFPCSTLLACTWNSELVYRVGEAGAKEVKENNIAVWLMPAVNIHRSPLCGRNFEYYSEDPFLTGKLAAAMVKGIQAQHIGATVKHFALNNKEVNRKNSDSRVSERAAREIYLELLDGILREEWGWNGLVTTDWWTRGEHYKEVKAGNDIKMATGYPERLMKAKELGLITREEMVISAKRVLELILKVD